MMRGTGGPLLCIGDLLSDVGEDDVDVDVTVTPLPPPESASRPPVSDLESPNSSQPLPSDLPKLFREDYDNLIAALAVAGGNHSWTALTLKLCSSLEIANRLVQSTSANAGSLSEKVEELEKIIRRADSAVAAAKILCLSSAGTGNVN